MDKKSGKTKTAKKAAQTEKPGQLTESKEEVRKGIEDPWRYLSFTHMTEKSIGLIEKENKLVFIVDRRSTKKEIKESMEKVFDVKVDEVETLIDQKGRKKAFIKLSKEYLAGDVATRLGMI